MPDLENDYRDDSLQDAYDATYDELMQTLDAGGDPADLYEELHELQELLDAQAANED